MKTEKIFHAILCGLAITTSFTSCSDDNDDWNWEDLGSKIEMTKERAFVLNEGSYQMNNAHLGLFDWKTGKVQQGDIYNIQNGLQLGDTGQDIIEHDDNIFISVYGSNYITKLNGVGKELGRVSFANNPELGEVRFMTAENGFIYVTSYGGYVTKINANTLEIIGSVKVGNNPEQIIETDGKIYCVNSGWGYDNRLSIIDERTFTLIENVEIFANPQAITESDGHIIIQGYGGDFGNYTYPVAIYDPSNKTYKEIGKGTNIAAEDGMLYVVNTTTDYSTTPFKGTTKVWSYNLDTGEKNENALQMPEELKNSCTYGICINEENNHIYILVTNYTWGNGEIFHFDNTGKFIEKFSSEGQGPKKIVFLD